MAIERLDEAKVDELHAEVDKVVDDLDEKVKQTFAKIKAASGARVTLTVDQLEHALNEARRYNAGVVRFEQADGRRVGTVEESVFIPHSREWSPVWQVGANGHGEVG